MKKKYKDMITDILESGSLYDCGWRLKNLVWELYTLPEREVEAILDSFWARLEARSAANTNFEDPGNRGWGICPQEKTVATYLSLLLMPGTDPEEDPDYLMEFAKHLTSSFRRPSVAIHAPVYFMEAARYMDRKYGYSRKVFNKQKALALFLPDFYETGESAPIFRYYEEVDVCCPHFLFFSEKEAPQQLGNLVPSPAYPYFRGFAWTLLVAAFAEKNQANVFHFPKEMMDTLCPEFQKDAEFYLAEWLSNAILADSPFKYDFVERYKIENPEPYKENRMLLEMALDYAARRGG